MRATASIVLPVSGSWELTRACLESLRPTLGVKDQVIVVDNASTDGTADGLRAYGWVTVLRLAEPQPLPAVIARAAVVAKGEVVVLLKNDTLVTPRWLDALLQPFGAPQVGATGPATNLALGPQKAEVVHYDPARPADVNRFARRWRDERRGHTTDVSALAGFCLALRRHLVPADIGAWGPDGSGLTLTERLCRQVHDSGHRLVVAHAAFVHHHGAVDWFALETGTGAAAAGAAPLVSASLIVKDEELVLQTCLDSAFSVADEVVVYDTGSTDRTIEIARAAGAKVVEGYWDDDFGRARNASLAACSGEWILVLDADEVVAGDVQALREQLAASSADGFVVQVQNVDDAGEVSFANASNRVFRRSRARWHGRLHEQVVSRAGGPLELLPCEDVVVRHVGYTTELMTSKGKHERNVRVALGGAEATQGADPLALVNLGRALASAGRHDEAVEQLSRALALSRNEVLLRQALRAGAETLLDAGRPEEALSWVADLRQHTTATMPDYLEGLARMSMLDAAGALACFERIGDVTDEEFTLPPSALRLRQGLALVAQERWADGADALLDVVRGQRVADPVWAAVAEAQWRAQGPMDQVADLVSHDQLLSVLGQVLNASSQASDALAEELWQRFAGDARLLAFGVNAGPRLPLERALEWSARLRAAGLAAQCPLVALARAEGEDPLDRLRAAAVAVGTFSDEAARDAAEPAAAALRPEQFGAALVAVDELAPALLPVLVLGAATTAARSAAMADVLRALGAEEQADALLAAVPG